MVLQRSNVSKRLGMWVAVGEKLPCQREHANSEDLFTVAVTGELIVDQKKISAVCSMFLRQNGLIFCLVTGSAARR